MTYPDGRTIDYNYSSGLDSVLSRVSTVSDDSGLLQAYSYLGMDTPVTLDDGNGVDLSYLTVGATGVGGDQYTGLDQFGRIDEQNWTGPYAGEGPDERPGVDQFTYTYDQDSNVLSKDEVTATTDSTTNTNLAAQSQTYTYDRLNRLTSFTSDTMNETYTLNAVGDRIALNGSGGLISSTSDAQNELTSAGGNSLTYDSNGNTDTDQNGYTYTYDTWNRLVSVSTGSSTVYYTYDALGRRITETVGDGSGSDSHGHGGSGTGSNGSAGFLSVLGGPHPLDDGYGDSGTTTDLYYSSAGQVVEEQQNGVTTTQYVWSPFYVNQMIERDDHDPATSGTSLNRRIYPTYDADYNITSLTNGSTSEGTLGAVLERDEYDPDGNVTVLNPNGTTLSSGAITSSNYAWRYTFQSGRIDLVTGLIKFGVRDYDPGTGTWKEQDPAGYVNGQDDYQDEIGNPVDNLDPSGMGVLQYLGLNRWTRGWGDGLSDYGSEIVDGGKDVATAPLETRQAFIDQTAAAYAAKIEQAAKYRDFKDARDDSTCFGSLVADFTGATDISESQQGYDFYGNDLGDWVGNRGIHLFQGVDQALLTVGGIRAGCATL